MRLRPVRPIKSARRYGSAPVPTMARPGRWARAALGLLVATSWLAWGCGGKSARIEQALETVGDIDSGDMSAPLADAPLALDATAEADGGAPADLRPISEVLQRQPFVGVGNSDWGINPSLGILTSRRHVLLAFSATATGDDLGAALAGSGASVAGAIPKASIVQLILPPSATFAQLQDALVALRALPGVTAAAEDVPMSPETLPAPTAKPAGAPAAWTWDWGLPADANWGIEAIRAPLAWNLKDHIDDTADATPVVAVLDAGFAPHPDLPAASDPAEKKVHGTQVAGVIAATWGNGQFTDGVAPHVNLQLRKVGPKGSSLDAFVATFGSSIDAAASLLDGDGERPRIVNMSLGYNWSRNCYVDGGAPYRCDPHAGATIADQGCSLGQAAHVRAMIAQQGQLFGRVVQTATATADMLFVVAAGNDAGSPPSLGAAKTYCGLSEAEAAGKSALSLNFPQDLSSPAVWAASHDAAASAHIVVVEALAPPDLPDFGTARRAPFSNAKVDWGAHAVFAPGAGIGVLQPAEIPTVSIVNGTSVATPLVTGSAAVLLSIEPALTDAQLIELLTLPPYADAVPGEGSLTEASLNLFTAVVGIDALVPGRIPSVRAWLADFDDGTADGMTLTDAVTGAAVNEDGHGDGVVDLKDFRRLRDTWYMVDGQIAVPKDLATQTKWDLNGDGLVQKPNDEAYPRAELTDNTETLSVSLKSFAFGTDKLSAIEVLQSAYTEDAQQPWPAAALPLLLPASADLVVSANAELKAKGVDHVDVDIVDATGVIPVAWLPYQKGLTGLQVGPSGAIFTVPLFAKGVRLRWRAKATDPYADLDLTPALTAGEDRVVTLNSCLPPLALLAPGNAYVTSYCLADPYTCDCLDNCGKCPNGKVILDASKSQTADGSVSGLSYGWTVTPSSGISCVLAKLGPAPEATDSLECMFGLSPTCTQMVSQSATVTVTVTNGCGATATAVRKIPINCAGQVQACSP